MFNTAALVNSMQYE